MYLDAENDQGWRLYETITLHIKSWSTLLLMLMLYNIDTDWPNLTLGKLHCT